MGVEQRRQIRAILSKIRFSVGRGKVVQLAHLFINTRHHLSWRLPCARR